MSKTNWYVWGWIFLCAGIVGAALILLAHADTIYLAPMGMSFVLGILMECLDFLELRERQREMAKKFPKNFVHGRLMIHPHTPERDTLGGHQLENLEETEHEPLFVVASADGADDDNGDPYLKGLSGFYATLPHHIDGDEE